MKILIVLIMCCWITVAFMGFKEVSKDYSVKIEKIENKEVEEPPIIHYMVKGDYVRSGRFDHRPPQSGTEDNFSGGIGYRLGSRNKGTTDPEYVKIGDY